jgi:hypothetical protein
MDWEPFVAAAVPPLVVWLLWRLQTLSVEVLRSRLLVLTRHADQKWIYLIVSWLGTFLHEFSHASVLLLTGHGIRGVKVGVEEGHVKPGRMHGGAGMLFFLVAALAPLFVPPALVLLGLWFILHIQLIPFTTGTMALDALPTVLRPELLDLPRRLLLSIGRLDLADWRQLILFGLVLLRAPGSRPSHVKGSRFHGTQDEGDVAALRRTIRSNPVPSLAFLLLLYGAFFALGHWFPKGYWFPMEAVWAVAATGILLALFGSAFWSLAGLDGRASALVAWIGPAMFVAVEVAGRMLAWPLDLLQLNLWALGAWLAVALVLGQAVPRRS